MLYGTMAGLSLGVRVEWQGNVLPLFFNPERVGGKKLVPFANYKTPVFLSPCTHTLTRMLYWLATLSTCLSYIMTDEHQRWNTVTRWGFAMPAASHTWHLCGGFTWVAHWLESKLCLNMSHWKCGCSFIWVHLCQHHCRGRKRKGSIQICMIH